MTITTSSGMLTFVLTDVEGSTRLWETNPLRMSVALADHDRIVGEVIVHCGGRLVKERGEGDSIFAVFPSATAAVTAASDMQQALWQQTWPEDCSIRVRVGIHTGESDSRDGDFYGPTINRCSRLRDAGHGGQALMSKVTREIVGESLPPNASITSLGLHRLKDLRRPESIFQLNPPGVPSTFPVLHTLDVVPNNLPSQISNFVGREAEVVNVSNHLRHDRILTLTGPGGVGKSRIAVQVAALAVDDFDAGVWWVDLSGTIETGLVSTTVAMSLGLAVPSGRSTIEALCEHIGDSQMLIILDNCEQVVEDCAQVAVELCEQCPGLRILATSREPLQVIGERIWRVPPMGLPPDTAVSPEIIQRSDAVQLFLDRAALVRAGRHFGSRELITVGQICSRLDGIPLAIELAAARSYGMALEDILTHLDDRLSLLSTGNRGAPVRQQTLRAVIDVSYNLLTDDERLVFERLSVFVAGFTLEAAVQVCRSAVSGTVDVIDSLSQLVLKSLVNRDEAEDTGGRYQILDTLRVYADEALRRRGDAAVAAHCHAQYYHALAERLNQELAGSQQDHPLRRLTKDHANLRAAMRWTLEHDNRESAAHMALALWRYWYSTGQLMEGRATFEAVLGLPGTDLDAEDRVRLLHGAGSFAYAAGDAKAAEQSFGQMLDLARACDDKAGIARALNNLGLVAHHQGDYRSAETLYAQSRQLKIDLGDRDGEAGAIRNLALVAHARGDLATARTLSEESLRLWRELAEPRSVAIALSDLANIRQSQGELAVAQTLYEESLVLSRGIGDQRSIAWCLALLGTLSRERGDGSAAKDRLNDALIQARQLGDQRCEAVCLEFLAALHLDDGALSDARSLLDESLRIHTAMRDERGACHPLLGLARLSALQGDMDAAAAYCRRSLEIQRTIDDEINLCRSLELVAAVDACRGDLEATRRVLDSTIGWRRQRGIPLPPSERAMFEAIAACAADVVDVRAWMDEIGRPWPALRDTLLWVLERHF